MDEFLAGLGKLLGTWQIGTVGEWVSGVIAASALFVAVRTQSRQQEDKRRSAAQLFKGNVTSRRRIVGGVETHEDRVHLGNFSFEEMRSVALVVQSPPRPVAQFFAFTHTHWDDIDLTSPTKIKLTADKRWVLQAGRVEEGLEANLEFEVPEEANFNYSLYFVDRRGVRWKKDLSSGSLKEAKDWYDKESTIVVS